MSSGECPFCKGAVNEDVVVYGGRCPQCLIEIPGEEAATNPGEQAIAQQAAEAEAARQNRVPLIIGLTVALLAVGGGGAWYAMSSGPEVAVAGDDDFHIVPLSEHRDLALPEDEQPEEVAQAQPRRPRTKTSEAPSTGGTVDLSSDGDTVESSSVAKAPAVVDLAANPLDAYSVNLGPVTKGPKGIVLSDPAQIEEMAKKVLDRGGKQLQQCYETRLKENEELRGAWKLGFVIQSNGATGGIAVRPLSQADKELEDCMIRNVRKWKFQRISEPMEIVKTYRFGPGW